LEKESTEASWLQSALAFGRKDLLFTFPMSVRSLLNQIKHDRDQQNRDQSRCQHLADDRPAENLPRGCADPEVAHSGTHWRMNAYAVIRIGRNCRRALAGAASTIGVPFLDLALKSADEEAFFAAGPMSMIKPTCA
jgi:hypothetical protein